MDLAVEAKLNSFFTRYKQRTYKKGEFLIWPDDDPLDVYYVKSGTVIEYIISNKGTEAILAFYLPTEIFPLSLVNGTVNDHYFEALFPSDVYRAPREEFIQFAKENLDVIFTLLKQTNKEMDDLKIRMAHSMAGDAYSKLVQEIIIIAKYGGEEDKKTGVIQIKHFVARSAAARTGLTVETISREMKKLKSKKLIDFRRNILVVLNLELLKKELDDY